MFGRSYVSFLRSIVSVLIHHSMDGVASDCIDGLLYMCDVPRITATVERVAVVAPGRPPSCAAEAASCTTLITARQGERITVTVNTGISISPSNNDSYVLFSDGSHTSARHCRARLPATPETGHLYLSTSNSMTVTYRSSSNQSFISIYITAIGCPLDDLIDGNNTKVMEGAFNRNGYSVIVTCEPGYLLSNTSTNASASCTWNPLTQTYSWSVEKKFVCQAAVCSPPPAVPNGRFTSTADNYIYLSSVTYSCNAGYQLNGTGARQCITVNGIGSIWSGTTPSCTAVDCGPPSIQSASFLSPMNTSYGAEFLYTCNSSNDPSGSKTAICSENKLWSFVSCEAVDCGLPSIHNAIFSSPINTSYGAELLYTCNSSYDPSKPNTARCSESKLWSFVSCEVTQKPGVDDSQAAQSSKNIIVGASVGGGGAALIIVAAIAAAFVIMNGPYEETVTVLPSSLLHMGHASTLICMEERTQNYVNLTSASQNPLMDQPQYESLIASINDSVYSSLEAR